MSNIKEFIDQLTQEDTIQVAQAALDSLPEDIAWTLVKGWIRENDLAGDAAAEFENDI
jgi:hypothetical protein